MEQEGVRQAAAAMVVAVAAREEAVMRPAAGAVTRAEALAWAVAPEVAVARDVVVRGAAVVEKALGQEVTAQAEAARETEVEARVMETGR